MTDQYWFTFCHFTSIGLDLHGLLYTTNAVIRHQTADHEVEASKPIRSREIQFTL